VRFGFDGPAIVLAAGVCFVLSGLGLLLSGRRGRSARLVVPALAGLLLAIPGAMLAEAIAGIDLGVDAAPLHHWLSDGNPVPGRMSPIACVGFALCGLVLVLRGATGRLGAALVELLMFLQLVLGIVGLLSNWLDIGGLYGWRNAAPVTVPAGCGQILLGVGIWLAAHAPDPERPRLRREEWHVTIMAGEILAVIALIAGLSGFAILQQSIEAAFGDGLEDNVADRRRSFDNSIRDALQDNAMVSNRPLLARALDEFEQHPDAATLAIFRRSANTLLRFDYRRVSYLDKHGFPLVTVGDADATFDLVVRLNTISGVWLAWGERGFVLIQQLPMEIDDRMVGSVLLERYLPALTTAYHNVGHIGDTAETRICALFAGVRACFPSARNPLRVTAVSDGRGQAVAMLAAMKGRQGLVKYKDARGEDVIAAYGPIGTLGLGLVLRVDVAELHAPIRRELEIVAPILLLLVAAGTLCLRIEITPLARRLRELATIDGLTGAFNRRAFMRLAEQELGVARRYGRPLSVMMLDADHFKKVNDTHGHDAGDAVLRALAATCRKQLRDVDLFGRLGGEEFAIVLPETPLAAARPVAERLRLALAALEVAAGGGVLTFTVSVGLAALASPGDTIEGLLKLADEALYRAKTDGRNRVVAAERGVVANLPEPRVSRTG
jgi:diguanylate cyclase (GGDEF)-like protein